MNSDEPKFLKFTQRGGIVLAGTRVDEDTIELSVRDTGVGISEHAQKNVFRQYRQLGQNRRLALNHIGCGLGLTIVEAVCTQMGGSVRLESRLNVGSCFTLCVRIQVHSADEDVIETQTHCAVSQVLSSGIMASKKLFLETRGGSHSAPSREEEVKLAGLELMGIRRRRQDVMLVDDNPMNIEVLQRLLEVRLRIHA